MGTRKHNLLPESLRMSSDGATGIDTSNHACICCILRNYRAYNLHWNSQLLLDVSALQHDLQPQFELEEQYAEVLARRDIFVFLDIGST